MQNSYTESQQKKEQFESTISSIEKELLQAKQNSIELSALYEIEQQTNTLKSEQITAVEDENTSLRNELSQLLEHISDNNSNFKSSNSILSDFSHGFNSHSSQKSFSSPVAEKPQAYSSTLSPVINNNNNTNNKTTTSMILL